MAVGVDDIALANLISKGIQKVLVQFDPDVAFDDSVRLHRESIDLMREVHRHLSRTLKKQFTDKEKHVRVLLTQCLAVMSGDYKIPGHKLCLMISITRKCRKAAVKLERMARVTSEQVLGDIWPEGPAPQTKNQKRSRNRSRKALNRRHLPASPTVNVSGGTVTVNVNYNYFPGEVEFPAPSMSVKKNSDSIEASDNDSATSSVGTVLVQVASTGLSEHDFSVGLSSDAIPSSGSSVTVGSYMTALSSPYNDSDSSDDDGTDDNSENESGDDDSNDGTIVDDSDGEPESLQLSYFVR